MKLLKQTIYGIAILSCTVGTMVIYGQSPSQPKPLNINTILSERESERFIKAIQKGLVVFQQDYALEGTNGDIYGRNKNPYFGRSYSVGYKVGNKILTTASVLAPWELDIYYEKRDSLTPFIRERMYRYYDSKAMIEIDTNNIYARDSMAVFVPSDSTRIGLTLADSLVTSGRFVYFYTDNAKSIKVSVQEPIQVKWAKSQMAELPFAMPNVQAVIGGLFFEEKIVSPGIIHYKLVAMMTNNHKKWLLRSLVITKSKSETNIDSGITPIREGKTKGKNKSKSLFLPKSIIDKNDNPDE
jgi:hypothetical protein